LGRKTARPAPRAAPEISRKVSAKVSIGDSNHRRPAGFQQFSTGAFRVSFIQSSARPRARARRRVALERGHGGADGTFQEQFKGRSGQSGDDPASGTLDRP